MADGSGRRSMKGVRMTPEQIALVDTVAVTEGVDFSEAVRLLIEYGAKYMPSPEQRRVLNVIYGFRTTDDGKLYLLREEEAAACQSYQAVFNPSLGNSNGPGPYAGRELTYYYTPVPGLRVAQLARTGVGPTLRHPNLGLVLHVTEAVYEELFGPWTVGSPEWRAWMARGVQSHS